LKKLDTLAKKSTSAVDFSHFWGASMLYNIFALSVFKWAVSHQSISPAGAVGPKKPVACETALSEWFDLRCGAWFDERLRSTDLLATLLAPGGLLPRTESIAIGFEESDLRLTTLAH
jgi:hypothetical protein